ncbi:hypothetical protein AKJ09_11493 [Labilithrix luteola]|uniref:Uncharacterized protein n=1 Tax=Labilithrix luteola TaxID=1391654 RepID=A0A0K1QHB3_9BACT|nr:hypothetical protein [Labilithrix luteola]AKV04830.1 hypothetical protein AKJ09_11493 [Labilithrix luteola]
MKAYLSLSVVAFVLGGLASIACSSSDAKSTPICQDDSQCQDDAKDGSPNGKSKSGSSSDDSDSTKGPSGSPKPGDASVDVGKPDAGAPPSDKDCVDLETCCDGLADFGTQLACVGLAMAGEPQQCVDALKQCKAGGGTIGQVFQSEHPKCSSLAACCTKFHNDGYDTTAADCQEWVETVSEPQCEQTLTNYQSFGECL